MKRHQKWMRAGARRNVGARHAKRRCALQPGSLTAGVRKAQETARQGRRDRNGRSKPAVDVATVGWKPAAPKGPGRDSAAGSVRSMTAPVPAREVARRQRNLSGNISSRMNRHRQRIITGRKKSSHTGQKKLSPGMKKNRPVTGRKHQEWRYFLTSSSFLAYSGAFLSGSCALIWR